MTYNSKTKEDKNKKFQNLSNYLDSSEPIANCLNLSNLNIEQIDFTPLKKHNHFVYIDLSNNNIKEINLTPLKHCKNLRYLDLSNNKIEQINFEPLTNIPYFEIIRLLGNLLKEVDILPLIECLILNEIEISTIKPIDDKIVESFAYIMNIEDFPLDYKKCFGEDIFNHIDRYYYHLKHEIHQKYGTNLNHNEYYEHIIDMFVKEYGLPKVIKRDVSFYKYFYKNKVFLNKDSEPYFDEHKTFSKKIKTVQTKKQASFDYNKRTILITNNIYN